MSALAFSPKAEQGFLARVRKNFFATPASSLLTLVLIAVATVIVPPLWHFLISSAVWSAQDGAACRAPEAGACWAFIAQKFPYFVYGSYPPAQRWRVDAVMGLGAIIIVWLLWLDAPYRKLAAFSFFVLYPIVAFVLLRGLPLFGLPLVSTDRWGGILVSLLVAITGIVVSLPLGVLLALGRASSMPIVSLSSVIFIEVMRGVPMITVLFMANTMLPLIVPENLAPDRLLRPLIGVALFASAYMAEVVRGGLQGVPKGQAEAAKALGLSSLAIQRFIILPQALTLVIPGVVNTFIGLFKDTTLVAIVGIFDFLRTVDTARLDPAWAGPRITVTAYIFAALFYFVFCFGMSRYSQFIEARAAKGRRH